MSPRTYRMERRRAASDETRQRVVAEARELLRGDRGFDGFSVDAVARAAGVARMTIYYQFGSRRGLLEAIFDSLASHRGAGRLVEAIGRPDPLAGLDEFVALIGGFWAEDRPVTRRLEGLAALDPDFDRIWQTREGLRRQGLAALVGRISERYGKPAAGDRDEAIDALFAIVSFATFHALAGPDRDLAEVTPLVRRLARAALGLPPAE